MKLIFSLIIFVFLFCNASAQNRTYTLSLYYGINETKSENNFKQVDSLLSTLTTTSFTLNIYGYADFLNTDSYNTKLSRKRADLIKNYLLSKASKININECKGLGEKNSTDNSSAEGEATQRRVDLVVTELVHVKKISTRENITHDEEKKVEPEAPKPPKKTNGLKDISDLDKGESMAIAGLNFIPGRHMLVKSAIPILEELLETLKAHPTIKIEIQGHICCLNTEEEDGLDYDTNEKQLSTNRAKAVFNYLIRNGIDARRLTYQGYGHTNPKISPERSPEDEQVNRRVEIKILEN